MNWDTPVNVSAPTEVGEVTLLTPGPVAYEVIGFQRGEFAGSPKLPACPEARLRLKVTDPTGASTTVWATLRLADSLIGILNAFFYSNGLVPLGAGGEMLLPWDQVVGAAGFAELKHYTNRNTGKTVNEISKWLYGSQADNAAMALAPALTGGTVVSTTPAPAPTAPPQPAQNVQVQLPTSRAAAPAPVQEQVPLSAYQGAF